MDDLDPAAQPRHCGVVMRDIEGGWECVECGFVEVAPAIPHPQSDGPALPGF